MNPTDKIKKLAEEYANCIYKSSDPHQRIIDAVLYGYELASRWNSPNEKPEKIYDNDTKLILLMDKVRYICMYNGNYNQWQCIFNLETFEVCNIRIDASYPGIKGWQYLPEPIKK